MTKIQKKIRGAFLRFPPERKTRRLGQLELDLGVEAHLLAEHQLPVDPQQLPQRLQVEPLRPRPHVDRVRVQLELPTQVRVGRERLPVGRFGNI